MTLNAHLHFNGNCQEAFQLYAKALGGRITVLLPYGSSPLAGQFPEMAEKILHATLQLDGTRVTGVDTLPAEWKPMQGFALQLNLLSRDDAERIYAELSRGGVIHMPLQKTFWAELFAIFTDRFGTPWEINHNPDL